MTPSEKLCYRRLTWKNTAIRSDAPRIFGEKFVVEVPPSEVLTPEVAAQVAILQPHYTVCIRQPPGGQGVPHVDGINGKEQWGLNFYIGDLNDHEVQWFTPKPGQDPLVNDSAIPSLKYKLSQLDLLVSMTPTTPILFNASLIHRGVNLSQTETRYCYSIRFRHPSIMGWERAVEFFKPWTILEDQS